MREIKFRGIDCCTGEWVYGFLHSLSEKTEIGPLGQINVFRDGKPQNVLVKGETVGEFTGIRDINGREVYEGDVVLYRWTDERFKKSPQYEKAVVEWDGRRGCWSLMGWVSVSFRSEKMEVIGNIHEEK